MGILRILIIVALAVVVWLVLRGFQGKSKALEKIIHEGTDAVAQPLLDFLQANAVVSLKCEWRFYIKYFAMHLTWAKVRAVVTASGRNFPSDLEWDLFLRKNYPSLQDAPENDPAILSSLDDFDAKMSFYIGRVATNKSSFAIRNCQAPIVNILMEYISINSNDCEAWVKEFEQIVGESMEKMDLMANQKIKSIYKK